MLIGGKLADIFGPKRIFITGLIIYSIGTTIASFSTSLTMLIIGWSILEGLGAALMTVLTWPARSSCCWPDRGSQMEVVPSWWVAARMFFRQCSPTAGSDQQFSGKKSLS